MPGIQKQWLSKEEFEKIQGANWTPSPHTHVKVDITDTPWAWADVSKTGSNLTDLATRQHAGLTDIGENNHHAKLHASAHLIGGGDALSIGVPVNIGTSNLAGSATNFVRRDHVHAHPSGLGDSLHHNKLHALTGTQHTAAGLTIGWVIKATGATTFAWGQLPHDKLAGLGDDDHNQYHNDARGDARYYTQTQLQTSGQAQVHWNNITNEPTYYPPEYHYHVGKDIISQHLVDLNDVEADDVFDVLSTAAIHGQGNYDWFGTWNTVADASTSAEIVVLSGADKMLRLTDNNSGGDVYTRLIVSSGHEMITGVVEVEIRQSRTDRIGGLQLRKGGTIVCAVTFSDDGHIWFLTIGESVLDVQAYSANTWYKIRVYYDCIARYAVLFIDNVFKGHRALSAGAAGDYVNRLHMYTTLPGTGYTVDFNKLKVFNLTI